MSLAHPRFPLTSLQDSIERLQYGTSVAANSRSEGLPVLRMNNLQDSGWDLTDLKYIELPPKEAEAYRLAPGDILFNRTNSKELVGKCAVFREKGHWVFASYLIRMKLNEERALPDFVAGFLDTEAGRAQIDQVSRQIIGMSNINAEEIRSLKIPLPPLNIQNILVAELTEAQQERRNKLAQAEALLTGFDGYLLDRLGIDAVTDQCQAAFATHLSKVRLSKRINPQYFHPERMSAIQAIQDATINLKSRILSSVVDFKRDVVPANASDNYIGLANVQSNTGELVKTRDRPSGTCFRFSENDVLFARLRPYLNKVHRAERSGVCSTEFHVISLRQEGSDNEVLPGYLSSILRSSIILAQVKHMMTGNTHPRLANEDVINLVVPVPEISIQREIVAEMRRRREESRKLRTEAREGWEAAKTEFERRLLGKESA